ncbi:type 1 glutamine amidotransferase [Bacteriovorax sp. PP10]|uniref:Type 1 glutamine amidotransferase n=1 Tax=Bacteriovorax antarcticus TaxID=3088717 RepID=A0ABU5VWD0_9BACT|nr:type 1 glutamine amidotransferase [Bacteriovorax sp. PP10]MEA9357370.1 type 1 glutamine amidotransferase [Bacteriovorax sp. PP10]
MRKVLVFQHVAHKILGTLNPTLKGSGLNMRYVNFERTPDEQPSVQKYNGLIILGGHMGVYEAEKYKHIKVEMQLIEEALKKEIPILGICLGAQLLAHVLGADVKKNHEKEIGWCDIDLTEDGLQDPLLSHFRPREKIFQLHGDTFDIPKSAVHLAKSDVCHGQAFRYGDKVYGLQFHLEVDQPMIQRWLDNPRNYDEMFSTHQNFSKDQISLETQEFLPHSMDLSRQTFEKFVGLFSLKQKSIRLGSR